MYYFLIGLCYWALNSFVRKLETAGDWLLPLVWFIAWPLALLAWISIGVQHVLGMICDWLETKNIRKHF